jgi:hypothetical protein
MAKILMRVEGMDGQIELMSDRVVIHREGLLNIMKYGMGAKREIPLGAISEIAFKDAGMLTFGQIEFVRSGRSTEEKKRNNASAVKFKRDKQPQFEKLKEKIFELVDQYARQKQ